MCLTVAYDSPHPSPFPVCGARSLDVRTWNTLCPLHPVTRLLPACLASAAGARGHARPGLVALGDACATPSSAAEDPASPALFHPRISRLDNDASALCLLCCPPCKLSCLRAHMPRNTQHTLSQNADAKATGSAQVWEQPVVKARACARRRGGERQQGAACARTLTTHYDGVVIVPTALVGAVVNVLLVRAQVGAHEPLEEGVVARPAVRWERPD